MNRAAFLEALRAGLAGMPPAAVDDVIADYEAHFAEGAAAGRSEEDIAAALGDPARLARELRAEAGLKRWEEKRSPSNAGAAVVALIGLGAIDILVLLPVFAGIVGALIGCFFAAIGVFIGGSAVLTIGPFVAGPAGAIAAGLAGLGMMAAATAGGALLIMITIALINALVWYGRLHFRLLNQTSEA